MAAFFHQRPSYGTVEQGFTPLFRLLEDYDRYSGSSSHGSGAAHHSRPSFQARFDVRETDSAYELHGELAGLAKKDVQIEFTDAQTLVVRGRIERSYTAGTPPAGLIEGGSGSAAAGSLEGAGAQRSATPQNATHQASVQEEDEDEGAAIATPATTVAEPAHHRTSTVVTTATTKKTDTAKYWVSERSVGEFARSFSFPQHVDQDSVTASLQDGVLTVIVPKAKKHEARRIAIA